MVGHPLKRLFFLTPAILSVDAQVILTRLASNQYCSCTSSRLMLVLLPVFITLQQKQKGSMPSIMSPAVFGAQFTWHSPLMFRLIGHDGHCLWASSIIIACPHISGDAGPPCFQTRRAELWHTSCTASTASRHEQENHLPFLCCTIPAMNLHMSVDIETARPQPISLCLHDQILQTKAIKSTIILSTCQYPDPLVCNFF